MRRPAAFLLAVFAAGIWTGYYLDFRLAAALWLTSSFIALALQKRYLCILLAVGMLGTFYIQMADGRAEPLHDYEGRVVSFKGKVLAAEDRGSYLQLIIKPDSWQWGDVRGTTGKKLIVNLSLSSTERNADVTRKEKLDLLGKEVGLKGRLTLPSGARNPGLFDYRLFLKTRGITGIVSANRDHLQVIGQGNPAVAFMGKVKEDLSVSLDRYMDQDSRALLLGILFGDKTLIEEDIYEDFQRNGCAHILSVSGIHVGIIYISVSRIFRNRRSPAGSVCLLGLLFFYAALANFSASVVRAVVMIAIHILSKCLHRRYDLLCCISFSAFLMLLYNPFYLFNLGFQLSYLAVFTLAFLLPIVETKIDKLREYRRCRWSAALLQTFAPIFVIQLGMAPASAYHFLYFSLSAFFINLPIIALAAIILPLGMGLTLLNAVAGGEDIFFGLGATGAELLIQAMIKLNQYAGGLSISSMNVTGPLVFVLAFYYGLFFFLTSESFWILCRKRNKRAILAICASIFCVSALTPFVVGEHERRADIVFVDVGQGDCLHLRTPSGKNILIDGGGSENYDTGKKILFPYLMKNGVNKVDMAIVTHLHQDHYGGIASLSRLMPVKKLVLYEANALKKERIMEETGLAANALLYASAGDRIQVEKDIYIDVLYPASRSEEEYRRLLADEEDENESSLVMRVYYRGVSLLITGDMGFEGERRIMELLGESSEAWLKADILKVGHHGSRYSTGDGFLREVAPRVAVIQVGRNNFGHPHPDVIEKLAKKDIMIYRNDDNGAILIDISRRGVRLRTML